MTLKRKGKRPVIDEIHINFLKEWFEKKDNIGKPFKYAFQALINNCFTNGIGIKQRACYD